MKKTLQISSYLNANTFYLDFFKALNRFDYTAVVFAKEKKIPKHLKNKKDCIVYIKSYTSITRFLYYFRARNSFVKLIRTINIMEYSITHAHSLFSDGIIAYYIKKQFNIPYIVAVRNTDINFFFKYRKFLKRKGIKILLESERVIFINNNDFNKLSTYLNENERRVIEGKMSVLPNGINDFWLSNRKVKIRDVQDKNSFSVLFVGNINKNKNILNLNRAINSIRSKGVSVKLFVVGKIEDKKIYKEVIKETDNIFLGTLEKQELFLTMESVDLLALPSFTETFGLVYIEAISQGLPILYSKNQGIYGYFEEGQVGYSCNPHCVNSIAEAIIKITRKKFRFSLSEIDMFSWHNIAEDYSNLYSEIIEKEN